nr:glycosyltransferase family 2 protein [Fodinibius halophilus]
MGESPKITVIIPHYNMSDYLIRAVDSVCRQDYESLEIIIVDDGSEEPFESAELLDMHPYISVYEISHKGKAVAVNKGLEEAQGEYITILDADDQLPLHSLSSRMSTLADNEAHLCIGSFETSFEGQTKGIRSIRELPVDDIQKIKDRFIANIISPFHQNAMLFSRELVNKIGYMDPEMIRSQDKDFAIRLLDGVEKICSVEESVYIYHRYERPLRTRIENRIIGMKYLMKVVNRHFEGWRKGIYLPWVLLMQSAKLLYDLFGVYKK